MNLPLLKTSLHRNRLNAAALIAFLALPCLLTSDCFAGKPMKWEQVPEAVRKTVLANGGEVGTVDLEGNKIGGLAVYEALGTDKAGKSVDLVITEDGKLVKTKDDDAADREKEVDEARAGRAKQILKSAKFSHPRDITHPFLPLASLKQDILEGHEGGKKVRIERTILPEATKTFKIGGQTVAALVMQDSEIVDGELEEVTLDYFAQDDNGTVYYLGETVDEYKNSKVSGHSGAWLFGQDTPAPGIILPGQPKVGDRFKSEDVSNTITESDEVVSVTETVTVPSGTYRDCVKVKETLADGEVEYKFYARGVGVVKEATDADVDLISHKTR